MQQTARMPSRFSIRPFISFSLGMSIICIAVLLSIIWQGYQIIQLQQHDNARQAQDIVDRQEKIKEYQNYIARQHQDMSHLQWEDARNRQTIQSQRQEIVVLQHQNDSMKRWRQSCRLGLSFGATEALICDASDT